MHCSLPTSTCRGEGSQGWRHVWAGVGGVGGGGATALPRPSARASRSSRVCRHRPPCPPPPPPPPPPHPHVIAMIEYRNEGPLLGGVEELGHPSPRVGGAGGALGQPFGCLHPNLQSVLLTLGAHPGCCWGRAGVAGRLGQLGREADKRVVHVPPPAPRPPPTHPPTHPHTHPPTHTHTPHHTTHTHTHTRHPLSSQPHGSLSAGHTSVLTTRCWVPSLGLFLV